MVNTVLLVGKIIKEPLFKYWDKKGTGVIPVMHLMLETNGKNTDQHEVVVFGPEAEKLANLSMEVGEVVVVNGKLKSKITDSGRVHEVYAYSVTLVRQGGDDGKPD